MNLTTTKYSQAEIEAIEKLQKSEKVFILALIENKIKEASKPIAVNNIYDILKIAEIDSGLTRIDNIDLVNLAGSAYEFILDKYPALTFQEFKIACKNGVVNVYGEWFGMCLKSVVGWIKSYLNDEVRKQSIKEWNKAIESGTLKTSEVPVIMKAEISKAGCIRVFNIYKDTGRFEPFPWKYYDMLNEFVGIDYKGFKTLITDPAKRKEIFAKTETEYKNNLLSEKVRTEKRGFLKDAEAIMQRIAGGFEDCEPLKNKQKTLMLQAYFDELIKQGKQLEL